MSIFFLYWVLFLWSRLSLANMVTKSTKLCVAISGANGFVAKTLRKSLQEQNIGFIGLARKNFKKYPNETKIITKDFAEKKLPTRLLHCNAFIHLIGVGKQNRFSNFENTNVNLTKKIIKLCKKAKIKKIIFNSGLGVSKYSKTDYFISKYKAEQEIINSGLDYTIFRPSYIIGKNDLLTKNLKKQKKNGIIQIPGSGQYVFQPIFVGDVAEIILQSITSKKFSCKIIDLVGPKIISYNKFIKLFAGSTKTKKINLETAYYDAIHGSRNYDVDDLNLLIGSFIGNYKKLKKLSGLNFTSFQKILDSCSSS